MLSPVKQLHLKGFQSEKNQSYTDILHKRKANKASVELGGRLPHIPVTTSEQTKPTDNNQSLPGKPPTLEILCAAWSHKDLLLTKS